VSIRMFALHLNVNALFEEGVAPKDENLFFLLPIDRQTTPDIFRYKNNVNLILSKYL
jgi:hypothetical protein